MMPSQSVTFQVLVDRNRPRSSSVQFIATELTDAARSRVPAAYGAPVMGVDVARFGSDQSVFLVRRGDAIEHIERHRGLDTMQERVMREQS